MYTRMFWFIDIYHITQYGSTAYLGMTQVVLDQFQHLRTHGATSRLNAAAKSKKNTTARLLESWATH